MAGLYDPLPYLEPDPNPLADPSDVQQLKVDTANVVEGRVEIDTFSQEYQIKIVNFYRFSSTKYTTAQNIVAKRTTDTVDII